MVSYRLTKHAKDVVVARKIKQEWIDQAVQSPSLVTIVSNEEVHYFSTIAENEDRCLKVVYNPLSKLIVTVYFDRNMRKKGCK